MMYFSTFVQALLTAPTYAVDPAAIYNGGYNSTKNIALRIGNGGAGQSGLIEGKLFSCELPYLISQRRI
jgi:hypothetical protein